jgi:SPP1 family predicted phage head-tail adaptor
MALPRLLAGQLRHKIKIKRATQTPDGKGGFDTTWPTIAEPYAEVLGQDGREAVIAQNLQGVSAYRIRIRYRSNLPRQDDQIEAAGSAFGGRTVNIRSVSDPSGDREQLVILADTASAQPTT